jgi:hypothetical protein
MRQPSCSGLRRRWACNAARSAQASCISAKSCGQFLLCEALPSARRYIVAPSRPLQGALARHRQGRAGAAPARLPCKRAPGRLREPETKTAAVERREASVLRHWTRGALRESAFTRVFAAHESAFTRVFAALWGACGPTSLARLRVPRTHPSACRRSAPLSFVMRDIGKPRRIICLASTMSHVLNRVRAC